MNGECRSIDGRYQIPDECHEFRIRKRFPHTTREFVKNVFIFFIIAFQSQENYMGNCAINHSDYYTIYITYLLDTRLWIFQIYYMLQLNCEKVFLCGASLRCERYICNILYVFNSFFSFITFHLVFFGRQTFMYFLKHL